MGHEALHSVSRVRRTPLMDCLAMHTATDILWCRVMCGLYAVFDIFEDLVMRKVNESDASKFAELWGCVEISKMRACAAMQDSKAC